MSEVQQSTAHRAGQLITQVVVIPTNLLVVYICMYIYIYIYIYIYNLVGHLHSEL